MAKRPGRIRRSTSLSCENEQPSAGDAASPAQAAWSPSYLLPPVPADAFVFAADGASLDSPPLQSSLYTIPRDRSNGDAVNSSTANSDNSSSGSDGRIRGEGDAEVAAELGSSPESRATSSSSNTPSSSRARPLYRPVRPPATRGEAVPIIAEALRFGWSEIFARWKLQDLTLGLYYLSRRVGNAWDLYGKVFRSEDEDGEVNGAGEDEEPYEPAEEIDVSTEEEIQRIAQLLRSLELLLCTTRASKLPLRKGMALLHLLTQAQVLWADARSLKASLLRPAFAVLRCDEMKSIVITIRGTRSFKDTLTDLVGSSVPFHHSPGGGSESPVLGYAHSGMMVAAEHMTNELGPFLVKEVTKAPENYGVRIVGHSLGAGTAVLMAIILRFRYADIPSLAQCTCVAFAPPSCMSKELAKSCEPFVTSVLNGCDFVPTVCPTSVARLRRRVGKSSWGALLRSDIENSSRNLGRRLFRASSSAATLIRKSFRRPELCSAEGPESGMVTSCSVSLAATEEMAIIDGRETKTSSSSQKIEIIKSCAEISIDKDKKETDSYGWSGNLMQNAWKQFWTEKKTTNTKSDSPSGVFTKLRTWSQQTNSTVVARDAHKSQTGLAIGESEFIDRRRLPLDIASSSPERNPTHMMEVGTFSLDHRKQTLFLFQNEKERGRSIWTLLSTQKQDTEAELNESIIAEQEQEMLEAAAEVAERSDANPLDIDGSSDSENSDDGECKDLEGMHESVLAEGMNINIRRTSSDIEENKTEYFIPGSIIHFLKKKSVSDERTVVISTRQEQYRDIHLCRQMIVDHQLPYYQKSIREVLQHYPR